MRKKESTAVGFHMVFMHHLFFFLIYFYFLNVFFLEKKSNWIIFGRCYFGAGPLKFQAFFVDSKILKPWAPPKIKRVLIRIFSVLTKMSKTGTLYLRWFWQHATLGCLVISIKSIHKNTLMLILLILLILILILKLLILLLILLTLLILLIYVSEVRWWHRFSLRRKLNC